MENQSHKFDGLLCRVVATEEQLNEIGLGKDDFTEPFVVQANGIYKGYHKKLGNCYKVNDYNVPESYLELASPLPVEVEKGVTWESLHKELAEKFPEAKMDINVAFYLMENFSLTRKIHTTQTQIKNKL